MPKDEQRKSRNSEELSERPFHKRLVKGGNIWLSFGNHTFIDVSPNIGYLLTNRWVTGVGATYIYSRTNIGGVVNSFNIYGGRAFTYYQIADNFLGYFELERLAIPDNRVVSGSSNRFWIHNTWIGVGYRQWLSSRAAVDILGLYDLSYNPAVDLYNTPLNFRMNFVFGL